MRYTELDNEGLAAEKALLQAKIQQYRGEGLSLDMSRGKPCAKQLDLSMELLRTVAEPQDALSADGVDTRNYGVMEGLREARELMAPLLGVPAEQVVVGGNASLNLMYDLVAKGFTHGYRGEKPWGKLDGVKFLCPTPGYDRHFAICESFGIEMIPVGMGEGGPDIDLIERLVQDESVKGMWCVPMYSNPDGITYSAETVRRIAHLRPAARDFKVFWDNAYGVHHLDSADRDRLKNVFALAAGLPMEDQIFAFASTSKITFSGGGISAVGASRGEIDSLKKLMSIQTIGYDKITQLMHAKFLKDAAGIEALMQRHAAIVRKKFDIVCDTLDLEVLPRGLGRYHRPKGGYFVSFYALPGTARRVVALCREVGLVLTPAGAAYPYGNDPDDTNIRIAPTFPTEEQLQKAMDIFAVAVRLAAAEKMLGD